MTEPEGAERDSVPETLVRAASHDGEVAKLVPAATVIVLRDAPTGLEVLLVRRSSSLAFAGGLWVFPGGRIEPDDHGTSDHPEGDDELLSAARRAAVRETAEEAGLALAEDALVWFSHWTPPERSGKRYETWFFVTDATPSTSSTSSTPERVVVDGYEITDHAWMRPADALRRRDQLEIELSPPTWISLWQLAQAERASDAIERAETVGPEHFATRIVVDGSDVLAVYDGDVGYRSGTTDEAGPRHRLRMAASGWVYERD